MVITNLWVSFCHLFSHTKFSLGRDPSLSIRRFLSLSWNPTKYLSSVFNQVFFRRGSLNRVCSCSLQYRKVGRSCGVCLCPIAEERKRGETLSDFASWEEDGRGERAWGKKAEKMEHGEKPFIAFIDVSPLVPFFPFQLNQRLVTPSFVLRYFNTFRKHRRRKHGFSYSSWVRKEYR